MIDKGLHHGCSTLSLWSLDTGCIRVLWRTGDIVRSFHSYLDSTLGIPDGSLDLASNGLVIVHDHPIQHVLPSNLSIFGILSLHDSRQDFETLFLVSWLLTIPGLIITAADMLDEYD